MYRHPNGGGLVNQQADVSPTVFVDRESLISNHVSVDSGHISRSLATGDTLISQSRIFESEVECQRLTSAFILNSKLQGRVVVRNSTVDRVMLNGSILCDGAELVGPWALTYQPEHSDYLRIAGRWERPPRFLNTPRWAVVEGDEQGRTVWVGCKLRPIEYWLSHGHLAGRMGISEDEIRAFIESL